MRARTAELQALFDSASVGIVLLRGGLIVHSNRRLDELFGYPPGEQIGQPARIWLADPDDPAAELDGDDADRLARGETLRRDMPVRARDGHRFWVRLSRRVIDPGDPDRGMVGIIEDITAEREALEEMIRAKTLAEEASRMKSDFLATMSHEIRTPMNAIIGMLYLALNAELSPSLHNYLSKAQGAAHSLLGIINDILDFSKIEAGKLELEHADFDVWQLVDDCAGLLHHAADQKGVELMTFVDPRLWRCHRGDSARLRREMSRTMVAIIRLRWVLELAGTTFQGAQGVLVLASNAS